MRRIETLSEAATEIRKLRADFDASQINNVNFKGRRITNAGDSKELQDYVTKKELDSGIAEIEPNTTILQTAGNSGAGLGIVIVVDYTLGIESNAAPELNLSNDFNIGSAIATVKQAPTGGDIVVELYSALALISTFTVLDGVLDSGIITSPGILKANERIRIDITSVGLTFPGERLVLNLRS